MRIERLRARRRAGIASGVRFALYPWDWVRLNALPTHDWQVPRECRSRVVFQHVGNPLTHICELPLRSL